MHSKLPAWAKEDTWAVETVSQKGRERGRESLPDMPGDMPPKGGNGVAQGNNITVWATLCLTAVVSGCSAVWTPVSAIARILARQLTRSEASQHFLLANLCC